MVVHIRIDYAGGNAVYADERGRKLLCERLGKGYYRALGSRIRHLATRPHFTPNRRYVYDTPAARKNHIFGNFPAAQKRARNVYAENFFPIVKRGILYYLNLRNARVVYKHVYLAVYAEHLFKHFLYLFLVGNVGAHKHGAEALHIKFGLRCKRRFLVVKVI